MSIAPDGSIWTGRNWNQPPASSTGYNGNKESGPFMFETIGNFDHGHDSFDGAQKRAVLEVIARVQQHFKLPVESLRFHNTMSSKSCPGTSIAYAEICQDVRAIHERLASEGTRVAPRGTGYPFDDHQRAIWKVLEDLSREAPAVRAEELNGDVCEHVAGFASSRAVPPAGAREQGLPQLTPDVLDKLRPHVVNLNQGLFSTGGEFQSDKGSADAIFDRHLEKELERNGGKKLRIVFYAHGGLTSERSALWMAAQHLPWWRANNIHPIFFVWETGLIDTLIQLFGPRRARDLEEVSDRVLQTVARSIGGVKIWSGMKVSAERSTSDPDGGALYVAQKLSAFLAKHNAGGRERVEVHAVGHSAGSIFHGYFAPAVIKLGGTFKTMHFLAPAIRTDTFKELLASHVGKGIERLTLFTMTEDYEKKDNCGPYRKSLLYLIFYALEPERLRPTPILGLDESLRNDPELVSLFDYYQNNPQAPGDIVWSVSEATEGPSASRCTAHGGFNEDIPTMTSVALRILDANEAERFPDLTPREISTLEALSEDDPEIARWLGGFSVGEPVLAPVADRISTVSAVQVAPGVRGVMRALCVGINRYPTAPLAGCVADAQEWQATFKQLGFTDVATLIDQQATRYAISNQLTHLITESRLGDVVAFQFAGHGTQLRDLDGDEASGDSPGQDEALCPIDFAEGHFLIDDDLAQIFNRIPDGVNVTCFTDCCHSGTITRLAIGTPLGLGAADAGDLRARFLPATAEMEEAHAAFRASLPPDGAGSRGAYDAAREVLFCACRSREVALESNGHGHFTTKATQVLRAGIQGLTNEELLRRILRSFGTAPRQNPELHCAPALRGRPLLGFDNAGGRSVSIDAQLVGRTSDVRYSAEQVAELLKAVAGAKNI